jgi:hypothetical protein
MRSKLALLAVTAIVPLLAKAPLQSVQVTTTARVNYTGGVIRFTGASGELNIEGWDEPAIEITLTRSIYAGSQQEKDRATRELKDIVVSAAQKTSDEILISTQFPHNRRGIARWVRGKTDAELDYRVMVPRNARVVVRHDTGDVVIYNVGGGIDAATHIGDLLVQLPEPGQYAIDAKCKFGDVYSDFDGKYRNPFAIGERLDTPEAQGAHKIYLRTGFGGIKIQQMAPPVTPTGTR